MTVEERTGGKEGREWPILEKKGMIKENEGTEKGRKVRKTEKVLRKMEVKERKKGKMKQEGERKETTRER